MDKRKGKTQYDEYFSDGIVELGRIGNVVTLKNNMSEEQADMHREKLTDDYDEKKMEIDNLSVCVILFACYSSLLTKECQRLLTSFQNLRSGMRLIFYGLLNSFRAFWFHKRVNMLVPKMKIRLN